MELSAELGLKFIERCSRATTAVAVDDFSVTIGQMGFEAVACGAWVGVGKNRHNRFFFVTWPADWLEFYNKNRCFEIDTFPIEARRRIVPFLWSEVREAPATPPQQKFNDAVWDYGWREVLGVPIHGPCSLQGLVALATREKRVLPPQERAILEVMARIIWERCRKSEGFGMSDPEHVKLSAREIECLQWAAAGKSDADIAALVGIKPATAHFHIEHAKKRLGVKTRVEAVAVGVLHGVL